MAFPLENFNFVKSSVILFIAISLCNANIQSVATKFTEKKCVATSHTTLQKISKIRCVEKCNQERQKGRCTLAGYNKATKTCYLSVDDPHDVLDSTDDMSGVFFYEPQPTGLTCATEGPLLDGTNPVPDTYFTATSEWSGSYAAHKARVGASNYWASTRADATTNPLTVYLQVRFQSLSTVVRVATKGGGTNYVTLYRLAFSADCQTFVNLLSGAGNNATFPANTDKTTFVENQLPTPITAKCLRIHPLAWTGASTSSFLVPEFKIEVYGCPSI